MLEELLQYALLHNAKWASSFQLGLQPHFNYNSSEKDPSFCDQWEVKMRPPENVAECALKCKFANALNECGII